MKNKYKILPLMALTILSAPLVVLTSCETENKDPIPPIVDPIPPVIDNKPTQKTLEEAVAKAKIQYTNVSLNADNIFRTKDYNTIEKLNANQDFIGMKNFNKNDRQIVINENGNNFIFNSTITKVEVAKDLSSLKVFWKLNSELENLESNESSFDISNFKVISKKISLSATGNNVVGGVMSAASMKSFNDFYLTSEENIPTDDFDLNELTVETDKNVGLNGVFTFTKEEVAKIKSAKTTLLDNFKPIDMSELKTFAEFKIFAEQMFPTGVKDDDLQELFILKEKTNITGLEVSNSTAVAMIKKTYFNNQLPSFVEIVLNNGNPIKGLFGAANDVTLDFVEKTNQTNKMESKIRINIDREIDGTEGQNKITDAMNQVKTFATDKLARLEMLFSILEKNIKIKISKKFSFNFQQPWLLVWFIL